MLSHWTEAVMCHLYAWQWNTQTWFIWLHIITLYSLAFWQLISPFYCEGALERGTSARIYQYIFTANICLLIRVSKSHVYASMLILVLPMQCRLSTVYCVSSCVCSRYKKLYNWKHRKCFLDICNAALTMLEGSPPPVVADIWCPQDIFSSYGTPVHLIPFGQQLLPNQCNITTSPAC